MLPAIASYYNVTVDNLLGVDIAVKRAKLDEYMLVNENLKGSKDTAKHVRLWREAYREFPNEPMVLHNLCWALRRDSLTEHAEEIISISKRLLNEATKSGEYFGAINNLCKTYSSIGNVEEAKRYAAMAGRYIGTENQLMIDILEGDAAADFCKWNIETLVDLVSVNADVMLQKGTFTNAERIHIAELIINLFSLIYEDGNFGFYNSRISKWAMQIAKWYAQEQDEKETLYWVNRAIAHAEAYDSLRDGQYTSPLVKNVKYSSDKGGKTQAAKRRVDFLDSCFDFIRHSVRQFSVK